MFPKATHEARKLVEYRESQVVQRALVARRRAGNLPDLLWLLEHPPTITLGSAASRGHLRLEEEEFAARGIALCPSERGGDVTFHEPGQLVGYPIVDLSAPADRDLHAYLRRLEEAIIMCLAAAGISGVRVPGRTGVWIEGRPPRKIAALGVRAQGWVTSHGLALNVENRLEGFDLIVPCGIDDAQVTSMARELGAENLPSWGELCASLHRALEEALERPLRLVAGGLSAPFHEF